MEGFKHGPYSVFPAGQQLLNEDGSPGEWMALASVIRWRGDEVLAVPVSWYPPTFPTEEAAAAYAVNAARQMIDAGRCKI